jgi:HlyD family secretion protein
MAADGPLFRKQVLDKLASPEQLNALLAVSDPKAWLMLAACACLVGTALAWGALGSVPNRVQASGILIHSAGLADVVALASGQVTSLAVDAGDQVRQGEVVARIAQPDLIAEIEGLRAQLAELKLNLEKSRELSTEDVQLRATVASSERVGLHGSIDAAFQEQRDLHQRLLTQQELLEKGLVTQDMVFATRRELRSAENRVKQLQAELERTVSTSFSAKRADETSLRADQLRIQDSELRLHALLERLQHSAEITSTYDGRVVEVRVTVGDVLAPGTPIVSLERSAGKGGLEALLYVDSRLGKRVRPGMQVNLAPSTVRRERHGVMTAEITRVESYASTRRGMMRALHNESLVDAFMADTASAPIAIRAQLQLDESTPSGYRWSSGRGPNLVLSSGTRLEAAITTSTQRPLSLVFSWFDTTD